MWLILRKLGSSYSLGSSRQKFRSIDPKTLYWEAQNLSSMKFLVITFDSELTFWKYFQDILWGYKSRYHHIRVLVSLNRPKPVPHNPNLQCTFNLYDQFSNTFVSRPSQSRILSSATLNGFRKGLLISIYPCLPRLLWPCANRSYTSLFCSKHPGKNFSNPVIEESVSPKRLYSACFPVSLYM